MTRNADRKRRGKHPGFLAGWIVLAAVVGSAPPARAQVAGSVVPTGRQEYFVLGNDEQIWHMMQRVNVGVAGLTYTFVNGMNSVVSAVASADGQVVIYDQWEDGYEADVYGALSSGTTLVIGDGNSANGRACDYTNDPRVVPCNGNPSHDDALYRGSALTFNSDQGLGAAGCIRCTVPVNSRGTVVRFDGGDRIATTGGPLSLIHNMFPPGYPQIGGSTEILPREAFAGATSYYVPAGEDRYTAGGPYLMFRYTSVDIVAFDDNTQVFVDSPGGSGGSVSFTLNKGQHYSSCADDVPGAPYTTYSCATGTIDPPPAATAAPGITINAGTKISATGPIAIMLFCGGATTPWATDFMPVLPDLLHGNDYVLPGPGDNPALQGSRPLNVYAYNPDSVNAINVTASDRTPRTNTLALTPGATADYRSAVGDVPPNSTVRLTSSRSFWGFAIHDHLSPSNDWGYSWLASDFLTRNYTVSFAPGVDDPVTASSTAAQRRAYGGWLNGATSPGDPDCGIPPIGPNRCDTINRAPVFVAAALDNTLVKVDFNNDGIFDLVDTNSDDWPDNGVDNDGTCGAPAPPWNVPGATANCLYRIDALQVLKIYDYTDYDNTGTRIQATKPIAVAFGQDTDEATGPDPILDTGYTVYPLSQRFLDPVLVVGKVAQPSVVSGTTGGQTTFTITARTYSHGPLTNLAVTDLLPPGLTVANYVAGSSLVTYPDLTQSTADPASALDPVSGRTRLTWTISPSTLGANQSLTVSFGLDIPPGPAQTFVNDAFASGVFGSPARTFNAVGGADVVRTNVSLTKLATDDGAPEPGDVITYSLLLTNGGASAETGVKLTDAVPPGTTYVPGTLQVSLNGGAFTSLTDAADGDAGMFSAIQDAVVWSPASFAAGATATFRFQVRIDTDTSVGTVIPNSGIYESNQTPTFFSNDTYTTVVGPLVTEMKSVPGGTPAVVHPGEVVTFEIQARNQGAGAAANLLITDSLAATNGTYVPGSMEMSLNGGAFAALTDATDADAGSFGANAARLALASLAPNADVRFRFRVQVNAGTSGRVLNNQGTVSADQVGTADTNLLQIPIIGTTTLSGVLFLDLANYGTRDAGEPGIANVTVRVTDGTGAGQTTQLVTTDSNGGYTALVRGGPVTVVVDETDPDMPLQAILTTANQPLLLTAPASGTVNAPDVGYRLPPLTVAKSADKASVMPAQTLDYAVTVTNNTTTTQTGITLTDAVPTGTTYVPGSAQVQVTTPSIRATQYYVAGGAYTGLNYTLNLAQPLQPDYFVIVRGAAGSGGNGGDVAPNSNYAALTGDPFGTGGIATTGASQLGFTRQATANDWVGVVTVVECLGDCDASGFRLLDVKRQALNNALSGTITSSATWSPATISRITPIGGPYGAGCDTGGTNPYDHWFCQVRLYPSGTNTLNWARPVATGTSTRLTVMVVRWGTQWTVQRAVVANGNNGAAALQAGAYNTVALTTSVARASTWVWGTGYTNDSGVGDSAEGVVVTLGNGVTQNATETTVSAGIYEAGNAVAFDIYTLSHPALVAGHTFKPNGDSGSATYDVTPVAAAAGGKRMAVSYNSDTANNNNFPRSIFSARYLSDTSIRLERTRTGDNFAAWVQGIDFSAIGLVQTITCANTPATCYEPSTQAQIVNPLNTGITITSHVTLRVTYRVTVDASPPAGLTAVQNDVTVTTTENPATAGTTLLTPLVRAAVDVEPNNAGYAAPGTTITFTQNVTNTGNQADSFDLSVTGEHGWRVDLVDPDTGVVIATDSDSNGTWDAGTAPNSGSLVPLASREYLVRVWVPAGATCAGPTGPCPEDTVRLRATSVLSPAIWDDAKNEISVLPAGVSGQVVVTPDNSGVVKAGSYTAYAHRVINVTGIADTFDLRADSSQGWANAIHWDTNGDGVYTLGVDLPIVNTAQLAPGLAQLIFVVVSAPAGTASGTRDVTHLTATSRSNAFLFGAATDTSTVVTTPVHDLSGGGSRVVAPGDTAVFPGTLVNLASGADRFDLAVTPSNLFGPDGDGLLHPTALWVDTGALDGVPDTLVATDADGDGAWDSILGGWDTNGDLEPDVPVAGGASLAYELRRPVSPDQRIQRDYVTLTSRSLGSPGADPDNVTATWIFAAVTRAGIRGVRVDGSSGEVGFVASTQSGTASFMLYETDDPTGATGREALHDSPVRSPLPDSITPILYRVRTRTVTRRFLMIEETETDGDVVWKGPFPVGDPRLRRTFEATETLMDRLGVPYGPVQRTRGVALADAPARLPSAADRGLGRSASADASRLRRSSRTGLVIEVDGPGTVSVSNVDLADAGLPRQGPGTPVFLSRQGAAVPFEWRPGPAGSWVLTFESAGLASDYSGVDAYVLSPKPPSAPASPLTVSADPPTPGYTRVERNALYVPSLPEGADPWQWDILFADYPWPDPGWDPAAGDFDLPDLPPGALGPVPLQLRVVGYTVHRHTLTASVNGTPVGSVTFDGRGPATLTGSIAAESLHAAGNKLSLTYSARPLPESGADEPLAYLDHLDLAIGPPSARSATVLALRPYDPSLPLLSGKDYLVVTHPLFRRQADRIARLKRDEGLGTAVVETDAAYDRFSGGVVEPRAIQALVRETARQSRGRLRFVLLVGDDSFDPRDFAGYDVPSFVPSLYSRDSTWGLVPSETPYADLDDDGRPDLAIGRLPVRTVADADAVAEKIAHESVALSRSTDVHLVVADNSTETDAPFLEDARRAVSRLPGGSRPRLADVAAGTTAARAAILSGWQDGTMMTHYFGHGGLTEWADEQVLTTDDVLSAGSGWKPTVLLTWACLSQWFVGVQGPSLNESLLLLPEGGAVASFGPAGISAPAHQEVLAAHLYAALAQPGATLGEAIRDAKRAALEDRDTTREAIEGFVLFGDPALRVPWPEALPE